MFTSRTFKKRISKKSRICRSGRIISPGAFAPGSKPCKTTRRLKRSKKQKGGDPTGMAISENAVIVNPMKWDDSKVT